MSLPVGPKMMVRTVGHARLTIDPLAYCTPIRRPRTDDLSNRGSSMVNVTLEVTLNSQDAWLLGELANGGRALQFCIPEEEPKLAPEPAIKALPVGIIDGVLEDE